MNPLIKGNVYLGENVQLSHFTQIVALSSSSIRLQSGCCLYPYARIIAEGQHNQISIDKNTRIQRRSEIHGDVSIGRDSIIASDVFISSGTHLFDFLPELTINEQDQLFEQINNEFWSKPVSIGSDVWIGRLTTVMPGISIGDRSVIGANSVVTKSIPAGQVWAGSPCRFIRYR